MTYYPVLLTLTTSLLFSAAHAAADDLQSHLERFFGARFPDSHNTVALVIKTPQAQWPECESPQLSLPGNTRVWGNVSVSVRCGDQRRFIQVDVQVTGNYVVSARPLTRGTTLTVQDLRQVRGRLDQLPPRALLTLSAGHGAVMLRDLPPGQPLTSAMIRRPWVIKSGQSVTVLAQGEGFSIHSEGKAMGNAAVGQSVRVRMSAGQIVSGIAGEDGIIRIEQ